MALLKEYCGFKSMNKHLLLSTKSGVSVDKEINSGNFNGYVLA